MKTSVLVDTSIWIEYFNKPQSKFGASLERLLHQQRVVVCGIILAELLQGTKTESEFNDVLDSLACLPFLETNLNTWIETGRISFSLRRKGITIPILRILFHGMKTIIHNYPICKPSQLEPISITF